MSDPVTVIREDDRPVVPFPGGPPYRPLIGDDNGANIPIRTGIQTSEPGYATREHSHPYVEVLTVLEGRGEAWLDGEPGPVAMAPGGTISIPPGAACTASAFSATLGLPPTASTPSASASSITKSRSPADPDNPKEETHGH